MCNKQKSLTYVRFNNITYPVYTVPELSVSSVDSLRVPYVFTLEKDKFRVANKLFIPDKVFPERTLIYLNESNNK